MNKNSWPNELNDTKNIRKPEARFPSELNIPLLKLKITNSLQLENWSKSACQHFRVQREG